MNVKYNTIFFLSLLLLHQELQFSAIRGCPEDKVSLISQATTLSQPHLLGKSPMPAYTDAKGPTFQDSGSFHNIPGGSTDLPTTLKAKELVLQNPKPAPLRNIPGRNCLH